MKPRRVGSEEPRAVPAIAAGGLVSPLADCLIAAPLVITALQLTRTSGHRQHAKFIASLGPGLAS